MRDFDEKRRIVEHLRPIDDAFFEKLMEDREVCEEILRVILEDPGLTIVEVIPQGSIRNLQGRSVRLDALCRRSGGSFCDVEMQKSDNEDHFRCVRYNASCITANISDPGIDFRNVPDVCIVYISTFDIMGAGRCIYHAAATVQETGTPLENGYQEIYVNTKVNDGSRIAELMQCFKQERVDNPLFPKLSYRISQFKDSEEGVEIMCTLIEEYAEKRAQEAEAKGIEKGIERGIEKGIERGIESIIHNMLSSGLTHEQIASLTRQPLERIREIAQEALD